MALVAQALLVLFQIYFTLAAPSFIKGNNPVPFIVGGQNASITDYPYQVQILVDNDHTCGGSIVNDKFILTAAHCFELVNTSQVTIRAGSSYRTSGGQIIRAANITVHPKFDLSIGFDNDVAIIELATSLIYGSGVGPIPLPSSTTSFVDGQSSIATGWGLLADNGPLADQLQVVTVPLITTQSCQKTLYGTEITSNMICAGEGGKDTCTGDSGGPLVSNGVQLGIVSWGGVCGSAVTPGVYAKVTELLPFINSIVKL